MSSLRSLRVMVVAMLAVALGSTAVVAGAESELQVIDAATVRAAFVNGAPLVETPSYKVHASRRDAAGAAEIHTLDTDIFYVLEGRAEIVTGGRMTTTKEVAPNEIRADAIDDGSAREIAAGDVVVIPSGVPHWFKRVDPPFVYYVVKVTTEASRE